mmetsp:Transcript_17126/g.37068  ORF Transcript_17126/g.37068 Transcript_17126/m.37068 type:complete len:151 (+) Transcript_17126:1331-1783(+)
MVDAAHEKEGCVKETIQQLEHGIQNLSRLVEPGAGLSIGQESTVDLLSADAYESLYCFVGRVLPTLHGSFNAVEFELHHRDVKWFVREWCCRQLVLELDEVMCYLEGCLDSANDATDVTRTAATSATGERGSRGSRVSAMTAGSFSRGAS